MPQHRRRRGRTVRLLALVVVAGATVTVLAVVGYRRIRAAANQTTLSAPTTPSLAARSMTDPSAAAHPSTPTPTPGVTTAAAPNPAHGALTRLVDSYSASSVSVAALDLTTGKTVRAGATGGMITASVAKLELLETLLLQHQHAGTTLSDDEDAAATRMIENSDNSAADSVFSDVGGRPSVLAAEPTLGVSTTSTVLGSDGYWGLTTSCADDQLTLLGNLVSAASPLDAASRAYALGLMRNVEADQRWGVPAAADAGTTSAVKDGWLAVDADNDLWAVNSDGVLTVDGDRVLISVLTQHEDTEQDGIDLVQSLAEAAASVVAG